MIAAIIVLLARSIVRRDELDAAVRKVRTLVLRIGVLHTRRFSNVLGLL